MRFLYGDSAPFPLGYDFLETLEVFMEASTRIVQLDLEASTLRRSRDELAQVRVKGLEALEAFHKAVMRAVQDTAQKVQQQPAREYARVVAEFASRHVDEHRRMALASNERENAQLVADNDRRFAEQRALLERFLKVARLPVLSTRYSMHLVGEGKEAKPAISAIFDVPDGIQTSFALSTSESADWAAPRKVSELAQGLDLSAGVDKSWLSGKVSPKQVVVDDWTITRFELSEESFNVVLKRKLAEKEAVYFRLVRSEAGLTGMVEHPGVQGAEALPATLDSQDLSNLDRLWQALRLAVRDLAGQKEQLLSVTLDGQPAIDSQLVVPFVGRLVKMFAPTVQEIAKRSPNEFELTLKRETEGNRREELFLRKEQLTSKLQPLSAPGRAIFAPLGLDTWVPGTTTAPPPVSTKRPPPLG